MIYILMGVSGAGKTLIGKKLSDQLGLPFYDGDDFHPEANVQKMSSGQPLNDRDRRPWLMALARKVSEWNRSGGAILACSALKKSYRELLMSNNNPAQVIFIYLKGSPELIAGRLSDRSDHFMPEDLLASQFEALEEPKGENAITVSVDQTPDEIVDEILGKLNSN